VLNDLFPPEHRLDLASLREYMKDAEPWEEEEAHIRRLSLAEIGEQINRQVLGQQAAVERVMLWIKRMRFGIPRDDRPAAVLLFMGPTGVGKTQLAKELARYVFGDENRLCFMEMGQFKTKESMSTFVGAPPGYVGYGDGKLTNWLADNPESVILFDEIEKADTQVFDTLLRFADEGFISDPAGPVRDGRKCIIVMTTNAGQQWLQDQLEKDRKIGDNPEALTKQLFDAAAAELRERGFRPEFLGRVDERIVFLPFTRDVCRQIVDKVLETELARLRDLKGIDIEVTEDARDVLAKKSHDRSDKEGARGVPRTINEDIISKVIDLLSDDEEGGPVRLIVDRLGLTDVGVEAA